MTDKLEQRAKQVAELLLNDGDGYCEIISELKEVSGCTVFLTKNTETGAVYKVTVLTEETNFTNI